MKNLTLYKGASFALALLFLSLQMLGQTVVIDPGHGYNSSGSNVDGRTTTEIYTALATGQKLRDLINNNNCGWTVHLTRNTNGAGGWTSVTQRATMSNNWNATRFISIHCNAGGGTGTETFYCNQSASSTASDYAFALEVQTDMANHGQWTNRRCVEDDSYLNYHLGVLRTNNAPACLSEIGFVDKASDAAKLNSDAWRNNFALAYYNSLQDELGTCSGGGGGGGGGNVAPQGSLYHVTSELSASYGAVKAFDGTTSTRWNSNGQSASNYFIIKLDKAYNINQFKVKHGSSAGLSANLNTERYTIYYWTGAWTPVVSNYNNSSKAGVTTHNTNISAEYVCLYVLDPTFTSDNYARIPEFEVYGSSAKARLNTGADEAPPFAILSDVSLMDASITAQPNPVTGDQVSFAIKVKEHTEATLELVDLQGRVIQAIPSRIYQAGESRISLNLGNVSNGMYFYRLRNAVGVSEIGKLIVL